jgi:hypothetical protein
MYHVVKRGYGAIFFTILLGISPDDKRTTNYPHLLITAPEISDSSDQPEHYHASSSASDPKQ